MFTNFILWFICQKDSIFFKIAHFSVKLLPLLFILIVFFHPLEEYMICNKDKVCTIQHKYIFNIKTKKQILINSESKLFFRKERIFYLPIYSRYQHPHPFRTDSYTLSPILQDSNNRFHKLFISPCGCGTFQNGEEISFAQQQKNEFENYNNGMSSEYKINITKNSSEENIFIIVFSLIIIVWMYILYRKDSDDYIKGFYIFLLAYLIMISAKLIEDFQYL